METEHQDHHHRHEENVSRVHFPEEQLIQHDSEIVLKYDSENCIDVHLGFLQVRHHYEVIFRVKEGLGEDLRADPLQNLHVKVRDVRPSDDGEGHDLTLEFSAYKEKLMREEIVLTDESQQLKLIIHARVLGKGKGTPAVKNGIKCTGIDADDDSELSDWQGFE